MDGRIRMARIHHHARQGRVGSISARVKEQMKKLRMDQKHLAASLGLSEGYISRLLRGQRPWTVDLILRTSEVLGVQATDLDPSCMHVLRDRLLDLELRELGQMKAAYALVQHLPKIRDPEALEALSQVLAAFSQKGRGVGSRP